MTDSQLRQEFNAVLLNLQQVGVNQQQTIDHFNHLFTRLEKKMDEIITALTGLKTSSDALTAAVGNAQVIDPAKKAAALQLIAEAKKAQDDATAKLTT